MKVIKMHYIFYNYVSRNNVFTMNIIILLHSGRNRTQLLCLTVWLVTLSKK